METRPYWEAAREHRFILPKCQSCDRIFFPPKSVCPECLTSRVDWTEMSGRASVHTFVVMHDTFIRGMDPPFVAAEVELDDQSGLHIPCNIIDCPPEQVRIGMPVQITFQQITEEVTLPQFRPAVILSEAKNLEGGRG
jgi:uncharacterized OB-fold protein